MHIEQKTVCKALATTRPSCEKMSTVNRPNAHKTRPNAHKTRPNAHRAFLKIQYFQQLTSVFKNVLRLSKIIY